MVSNHANPPTDQFVDLNIAGGGGATDKRPDFVVGVLAHLHGDTETPRLKDRRFVYVNIDNFDAVMQKIRPSLKLLIQVGETSEILIPVNLQFSTLQDFNPVEILLTTPTARKWLEARDFIARLIARIEADPHPKTAVISDSLAALRSSMTSDSSILGAEVADRLEELDPSGQPAMTGTAVDLVVARDVLRILDRLLLSLINAILNHPRFVRLEGTWRGLFELVLGQRDSQNVKILTATLSFEEFVRDLNSPANRPRLGTWLAEPWEFGDPPFALMVADFNFNVGDHAHVETLRNLAALAAETSTPFVAGADAASFGLESYLDLNKPRDLVNCLLSPTYAPWHSLRDDERSRYLALCVPSLKLRRPAAGERFTVQSFEFSPGHPVADQGISCNGAFGLALSLMQSFVKTGWFMDASGRSQSVFGGRERSSFVRGSGPMMPTDIALPVRRARELQLSGFVPLMQDAERGASFVCSLPSIHKPAKFDRAEHTESAQSSVWLNVLMCACRVAHIVRMTFPFAATSDLSQVQAAVMQWLSQLVVGDGESPTPRHPLRGAQCRSVLQADGLASLEVAVLPGYGCPRGARFQFTIPRRG